jgi:hypothetical protein
VVWFFEKHGAYLRCETRDVPGRPGHYELVIVQPDGTETVERFAGSETLMRRQQELESQLATTGWQGPHGRFF